MKYIRTKRRVWEYQAFLDSEYYAIFGEEEIIAQADTIEELCDCYVIKDRDERLPFVSNTDFDYANNKDKNNFDVYGAIWVDVDLKSIAKMNEKGELELL